MKASFYIFLVLVLFTRMNVVGQNTNKNIREIDFNSFNELVLANNFEFLIEKFEVSKAEAAYVASKVFQNPELEIILPRFLEDDFSGFPYNLSFEIEIPIELFGKRKSRIRQARAEKYAAQANLEGFLHELRIEIASVFVVVIAKQMMAERMQTTLEQLNHLVQINQILFEAGEIGRIEVLQTLVEARNFETVILDEQAEMKELMSEVYLLLGGIPNDSLIFVGNLEVMHPVRDFTELRDNALAKSNTILKAKHEENAALYGVKLARAERYPDISIVAGYHNDEAIIPMPGFKYSYVGVKIPLQFSGFNKGNYLQEYYRHEQSKLTSKSAVFEVDNNFNLAWKTYQIMLKKRLLASDDILNNIEIVRDAVFYSYQKGEASLLELIEAQRTSNETYVNYYNALVSYNLSVIELSRVSHLFLFNY